MAVFRIRFRPAARHELKKLPPPMKLRVGRAIEGLAQQPRPPGAQLLSGMSSRTWRIRVGDYRVLYEIRDDQLVVLVLATGHRGEIYRRRRVSESSTLYDAGAGRPQAHGGRSWSRESLVGMFEREGEPTGERAEVTRSTDAPDPQTRATGRWLRPAGRQTSE